MSRLIQNATPAEVARGCVASYSFENSAAVAADGGTIYGTPSINFGAELNGTTDRIQYALLGHEFNSTEISAVVEFVPEFATNENMQRAFLDSDTGDRFLLYKQNNIGSNTLTVYISGTSVAAIPEATYSPYWLQGRRNVLVVSGTAGNTNAWLNGSQILTAAATAWAPSSSPLELFVGSNKSGGINFKGSISQVKIFHSLLTAQEAADYYNETTYLYMNDAVVNLPMLASTHDPTNFRTLDVSGNLMHATLGDGSTSTTFPTKLAKRGYSFDGSDYLEIPAIAGIKSVFILAKPKPDGSFRRLISKGSNEISMLLWTSNTFNIYYNGTNLISGFTLNDQAFHTFGFVFDGTNVTTYLDGIAGASVAVVLYTSVAPIRIGSSAGSQYWNNKILDVFCSTNSLSPLQVADLHLQMMQGVNNV